MINEKLKNDIGELIELDSRRKIISKEWDNHVKASVIKYAEADALECGYFDGPTDESQIGDWHIDTAGDVVTILCKWADRNYDNGIINVPIEYVYDDSTLDGYTERCKQRGIEKRRKEEQSEKDKLLNQYNDIKRKLGL